MKERAIVQAVTMAVETVKVGGKSFRIFGKLFIIEQLVPGMYVVSCEGRNAGIRIRRNQNGNYVGELA